MDAGNQGASFDLYSAAASLPSNSGRSAHDAQQDAGAVIMTVTVNFTLQ
jgi:hypothetical protein